MSQNNLLQCYNRGCGKQFDPDNNKEGDCTYHPGEPFFHDVYKGWSCCKKKCIDFTEFLNIKGCKTSCHSNVKPPEVEKPSKSDTDKIIEIKNKPIVNKPSLKRPPFDSPQIILKPTVSSVLLDQTKDLIISTTDGKSQDNKIVVGQSCKNNSCKGTYMGPESNDETCKYHPGVPIFHEGMKYWSCCEKKTADFSVFLEQPGCTQGKHLWLAKNSNKKVECRVDWHQTATFVVISIYAKKYNPNLSSVKLNPIRLTVDLFFPEENSTYHHDIELRGIVDVVQSTASMFPTKIEINLKKAEPGSWSKLDFPRDSNTTSRESDKNNEETEASQVDAVDLSDL